MRFLRLGGGCAQEASADVGCLLAALPSRGRLTAEVVCGGSALVRSGGIKKHVQPLRELHDRDRVRTDPSHILVRALKARKKRRLAALQVSLCCACVFVVVCLLLVRVVCAGACAVQCGMRLSLGPPASRGR